MKINYTKIPVFLNAVKIYDLPNENSVRSIIKQDNHNKWGIYAWMNKINGKYYIGSSANLFTRYSTYMQLNYLKKYGTYFTQSILKYGFNNFVFLILEYSKEGISRKDLYALEQNYLDKYKPEYNVLKKVGSSLGYKHTLESKLLMSMNRKGILHSQYGKSKSEESKELAKNTILKWDKINGKKINITIIDTLTNTTHSFDRYKQASLFLGCNYKNLMQRKYRQSKRLYLNRFKINFITDNS